VVQDRLGTSTAHDASKAPWVVKIGRVEVVDCDVIRRSRRKKKEKKQKKDTSSAMLAVTYRHDVIVYSIFHLTPKVTKVSQHQTRL